MLFGVFCIKILEKGKQYWIMCRNFNLVLITALTSGKGVSVVFSVITGFTNIVKYLTEILFSMLNKWLDENLSICQEPVVKLVGSLTFLWGKMEISFLIIYNTLFGKAVNLF